ncbi:MAG TPA: TIGR01244 family sulfur transferase [Stellaceae bacterium]|nr:TIGR01244 family sulfur transferase [Stellaceae bacterium]
MAEPTKINDNLSVAGQISLTDIPAFAKAGFATILNNRPDDEEPGQLNHETAAAEARKAGLSYQYQPIVSSAIALKDVVEFQKLLQHQQKPILAHCRSGTRCYLMYGLTRVLFEGESPLKLVAEAAAKGYDIRALPMLAERLEAQK